MKTSIIACCCLLMSLMAYAQNDLQTGQLRVDYRLRKDDKTTNAEGSPYIHNKFVKAKINKLEEEYFVKYNAYLNQFEFKPNRIDAKIKVLPAGSGARIELVNSNIVYEDVYFNGDAQYMKVYEENEDYTLYVKEVIVFEEAEEPANSYAQPDPAQFVRENDILYLRDRVRGKFEEIDTKKRTVRNWFKELDVKKLMKTNDIKLREKDDLVALLNKCFEKLPN